jgi:pyruvate ferredoxin oxidoreductase beta subunit
MVTLKELAREKDKFTSGHGLCPGCGISILLKVVLRATKHPLVVSASSGCLQMASTNFPSSSWKLNFIHCGFENAASVATGIEAMYLSLKKQGKLDQEIKFLIIGGDGATYDGGFRSLSGAIERGGNFVYLCYDNQLNASSGGQRTSSSPMGASTTTTPSGKGWPGKLQFRKDISKILEAHKIPYLAQSAPWIWKDLYRKAEIAFETTGPVFLNVLSPCPTAWKTPLDKTVQLTRLAADTCVWPIYEIKDGTKVTVNYKPKNKLPVTEWLKTQARFQHLLKPENKWVVEKIQKETDFEWEHLLSSEKKGKIS